jgi:hypothetical protein
MHVPSRQLLILSLVGACLAGAVPAAGQIVYGQQTTGSFDVVATHWKLTLDQDEATVDQWAIPIMAYLPLRDNLEARLYTAYSTTTVNQLGQDFKLQGLSDMRVQVNQALADDRLLLGAGLNLPVGKKALNLTEEWVVMNYLTQSFLSFPVRNLGGGFGVNLMAGAATEVGEYRLGATATLDLAGSYEAYLAEADYKPGNALSLTLGLQRNLGERLLNGDITLTTSADDKQDDLPVLSRGDQVTLHSGLTSGGEHRRYYADASYRLRGRNTLFDPTGVLVQQLKIYGNEFTLAGGLEFKHNEVWHYGPSADLRLIAGNEIGLGNSKILGVGGQVARAIGSGVNLRLALKVFTGSTHDGEIDLGGYQVWLAANGTF